MEKDELKRGDIVIETEGFSEATAKHKAIIFGQSLTRLTGEKGHSKSVHAALWIRTRASDVVWIADSKKDAPAPRVVEIVEASGSGSVRKNELFGHWRVYRVEDEGLREEAARIAETWASWKLGYAKSAAVFSIFGSPRLDTGGEDRAEVFALNASETPWRI